MSNKHDAFTDKMSQSKSMPQKTTGNVLGIT